MTAAGLLQGPFAIASSVLVVSGILKLRDPAPTAAMLRSLRLPAAAAVPIAIGLAEIGIGVVAVVVGGRWAAAAVAVAYAAFTVVSARLLAGGEQVDCGCFGRRSAPMTGIHVGVNLGCALVAVVGAVVDVPGLVDLRPELPAAGVPQIAYIGIGTTIVVALLTVLPETMAAARGRRPAPVPVEFSVSRRGAAGS